eukprot:m.34975 g.34975  ORF g.34975 m.34975 type:complete len:127 (+) comp9838_c0_seq2:423-803(+)
MWVMVGTISPVDCKSHTFVEANKEIVCIFCPTNNSALKCHLATTVLKKFNATFTDYLNRVVSPQFDYRVTFRCEAFGEGNVLDAAEFNHMQMFFVSPVTAMCLESEFHSASLLNVRRIIHGRSPFM